MIVMYTHKERGSFDQDIMSPLEKMEMRVFIGVEEVS